MTRRWPSVVVLTPLILVNAVAIWGQKEWAVTTLTDGNVPLAVGWALTIESIALYLAWEARTALLAGDAATRLRVASYAVAGLVGVLNYSHYATSNPTAAVVFGLLSASSPWLWAIRSRSMHRDQLRATGLIDPRTAHFAMAKWLRFPGRAFTAWSYSVDRGEQSERVAWKQSRKAAEPVPAVQVAPAAATTGARTSPPSRTDTRTTTSVARKQPARTRSSSGRGGPSRYPDVAALLAKTPGATGAAIARELGISQSNARLHRARWHAQQQPHLAAVGD